MLLKNQAARKLQCWITGKQEPWQALSSPGRKGAHGATMCSFTCDDGLLLVQCSSGWVPCLPCASRASLWALWHARERASHLNHLWLQFTEKHGQLLLLYSFVYSLCWLRLNSSWFMSAWCQSKPFSLDLCWNLILQTVRVCYCQYLNLVIFVFLT